MARWIVYVQRDMELGRIEAPDRRPAETAAAERYGLRVAWRKLSRASRPL